MKQKKLMLGLFAAAGMVLAQAAGAQTTTQPTTQGTTSTTQSTTTESKTTGTAMGTTDKGAQKFLEKVAKANNAEVELGRLGADKAASSDVKQYAQHMVDDHSKANSELSTLASSKGVTVASDTDKKAQKTSEKLSKLSGEEFDRQFVKEMVSDHKKVVADFQKEARSGKDPDVKAFAEKMLPTLQEHLQKAQELETQLKGTSTKSPTGTTKSSS